MSHPVQHEPPRILIVEDELLIAALIRRYLKQLGYDQVATSDTYAETLRQYAAFQPDLVLLDIRLRGAETGIDIAHWIRGQPRVVPFIYLTSQLDSRHLDLAKATLPEGYLAKPIQPATLRTTIEMALHRHRVAPSVRDETITLVNGTDKIVLSLDAITHIEADHVYVRVHSDDGRKILQRSTLAEFQKWLPAGQFVQVHRGFIVHVRHVRQWSKDELQVGEHILPISRSRRDAVDKLLTQYFGAVTIQHIQATIQHKRSDKY